MKKFLLAVMMLAGVMGGAMAMAPAASAYPELTCTLSVDPQTVTEGETFTATGTAAEVESSGRTAADSAIKWTVTFNGITKTGTGSTFAPTFTAPAVDKKTTFTLTASSTSPAGTCTRSADVTVLPDGTTVTPPDGGLPNAGGPRLLILIAGLALLGFGFFAVRRASRTP